MSEPVFVAVRDDRLDLGTVEYDPATNPYTELFQDEGMRVRRTTRYQAHPDTDTQAPGKTPQARTRERETPKGSHCGPSCTRPTASQAHCSVCHNTFGGVHGFDMHRKNGFCLDPAELGLAVDSKNVWRRPAPETTFGGSAVVGEATGNA